MKTVTDRVVQYANRYQLTDVNTNTVLGTFDFDEVTGTVTTVGTEINKELFDSIAADIETLTTNLNTEISERKTAVSQLQSDIEDGTVVAGKAVKLQTARRITVSLTTAAASGTTFDGSANVTIGVTGILPVANGGTGATSLDNVTVGAATYATSADSASTATLATTVTTTENTTNTLYPVGVTNSATTTLKRDTSITMSGDTITATTFSGSLSGNATSADKVNSTFSITLNDTTTIYDGSAVKSVSFYAPTSYGTSGYVLMTNGRGIVPTWTAQSNLSVGSATKATQDDNGNVISDTYVSLTGDQTISGTKTFSNAIIGDLTGNADTATKATHAAEADIAYYAAQCETAVNAETADLATEATHAENADNATEADHAAEADLADEATVANKLANALTVGSDSFDGSSAKSFTVTGGNYKGVGASSLTITDKRTDIYGYYEGSGNFYTYVHKITVKWADGEVRFTIYENSSKSYTDCTDAENLITLMINQGYGVTGYITAVDEPRLIPAAGYMADYSSGLCLPYGVYATITGTTTLTYRLYIFYTLISLS